MRRDVQEIFKMTPHEKQVMMFSATLSKEIRPVCRKFMQDVSWMEINIKPPACSLFYHSVALQKFQSCLIAFLRLLLVHCFVEMPLVALPTCGCQCHKCPYQRGKVILPGTSHSARTLVCPGFAAAQENKISHSRLTVYIVYTRWELTWNFLLYSCRSAHGSVCGWRDQADPPRPAAVLLQAEGQREEPEALRPAWRARVQPGGAAVV